MECLLEVLRQFDPACFLRQQIQNVEPEPAGVSFGRLAGFFATLSLHCLTLTRP